MTLKSGGMWQVESSNTETTAKEYLHGRTTPLVVSFALRESTITLKPGLLFLRQ